MGVYDINNIQYLEYDIKNILVCIDGLYDVEFRKDETLYNSKIFVSKENIWASDIVKETFNNIIPKVKSLHKDMYALIEVISKLPTVRFDTNVLEETHSNLKEFRLFNNKLKHGNANSVEINLLEIVEMKENGHFIDIGITFRYISDFKLLRFSDFIEIFFRIIEQENIITANRD